ncbi:30S ribosomal protein S17 [Candidatus Peregrinibacteria bacterium]|jgi:small subunit ribosomal protein S17|nr:30S ribosomal protein S17 [Candidatus Peregrinibacteria bacterium]MBT6401821.1 30S ribosomal protein S17 [candidate division WWE3 bacterium]MBT7736192.1 30S ribosomal protein S17 [Candidatus Peregrinibacteria bacterium]
MIRTKKGVVSSNKQEKTLVVEVHTYEAHPKYKKRYRKTSKFHADNPENTKFEIGDDITIYETRPLSKLKRWTIIKPNETTEEK